jgi:hypothetical protein
MWHHFLASLSQPASGYFHVQERRSSTFFVEEKNWSKGLDWYRAQFPEPKMIRGESSQNYSKAHMFHGVPERIKSVLKGEVRFLYITRDPSIELYRTILKILKPTN